MMRKPTQDRVDAILDPLPPALIPPVREHLMAALAISGDSSLDQAQVHDGLLDRFRAIVDLVRPEVLGVLGTTVDRVAAAWATPEHLPRPEDQAELNIQAGRIIELAAEEPVDRELYLTALLGAMAAAVPPIYVLPSAGRMDEQQLAQGLENALKLRAPEELAERVDSLAAAVARRAMQRIEAGWTRADHFRPELEETWKLHAELLRILEDLEVERQTCGRWGVRTYGVALGVGETVQEALLQATQRLPELLPLRISRLDEEANLVRIYANGAPGSEVHYLSLRSIGPGSTYMEVDQEVAQQFIQDLHARAGVQP